MTEINTSKKKTNLFWDTDVKYDSFEQMIETLIRAIQYSDDGEELPLPAGVYGIPRGGCVMAAVISNRLNIPMLAAPCKGCIVVDDIAVTLKHYQECGYPIYTWMYKTKSIVKPDWYYDIAADDEWIVFPWEG